MTSGTRAFLRIALVALLGAALLHLLFVVGIARVWPALIHLTLFGWITGMILTVNYHMLPVFSGRRFPYPRLIRAHSAVFAGGVALTVAGLLVVWPMMTTIGLMLELVAALLFVVNTVLLFRRGPQNAVRPPLPPLPDQPRLDTLGTQATKSASICLPLALLGLLATYIGWLDSSWLLAAEHLTTLGWISLMIVGVAYHVLPRFSGRAVRGYGWARAQLACHLIALLLTVLGLGSGSGWAFALGGALMTLALALFAWTIWPTLVAIRPQAATIRLTFKERPR